MALHEEMVREGNLLFRWRSYLPLLFLAVLLPQMRGFAYPRGSHALHTAWECACLAVSFLGLCVRAYTIGTVPRGTSGRNTATQVAEELNTSGIYSVVRNPLYLGNFFTALGVVMFVRVWWVVALYALVFWLYYERIILAEEHFLRGKFGAPYLAWTDATPAFWPRPARWRPPSLPFSLRNVLKREYSGLLAIVAPISLLEFAAEYLVQGRLVIEPAWAAFLGAGIVVYLALRTLARHTRVLHVEGR